MKDVMKKILVTTDLSDNSIAGLRFAIQLAAQAEVELVFLHVPDTWSTISRAAAQSGVSDVKMDAAGKELEDFVGNVYRSMQVTPGRYECVMHYHFGVVLSIIDYAVKNNCDYICISTHGAGNIEKYIGTNTAELIRESPVPVLCIPKNYIPVPVTSVLYASDLTNYEKEIEKVISFGTLAGAEVQVLHCLFEQSTDPDGKAIIDEVQKKLQSDIKVHFLPRDICKTLPEELNEAVERFHPSVLVMFTEQNRSFFDRLFLSSKTESFSFSTKVPLLAFNKEVG